MTHDPSEHDPHDEFLRLFSRHSRRIYEFILTLVLRHSDADDIFQETCLVLWKKFDTYNPEGSFSGWACRIAHLEVLQFRRKNQRRRSLTDEALAALAEKALTHGEELTTRQQALQECLRQLDSKDKLLIEQRYHQRRLPKEIAQRESRSVHSVYRALARIHNLLMVCVQRRLLREASR